jgi:serine-type D-Ala-D-Ala carboxypeptidase/endopeptidase (penicillin-binding protein 4)
LGERVAALLADPRVAGAHWGVAVAALDGTPIYGLDEGKLFRPASTAKLFTTTAAVTLLGPDRRFTTQVIAEGRLEKGVLHGNLLLAGGGDANFAPAYPLPYTYPLHPVADPLADLAALSTSAVAGGLRRVEGSIVGDDTRFEAVPFAPGVADEDKLWGYGAPVSALVVHDNELNLTVNASPGAEHGGVELAPALPYYKVNPGPLPGGRGVPDLRVTDTGGNQVSVLQPPGSHDLFVQGTVDAKEGPERDTLAISEPAEYGALALRDALARQGVSARGITVRHYDSGFAGDFLQATRKAPEDGLLRLSPDRYFSPMESHCQAQAVAGEPERTVLAEHTSGPLIEDVVLTLKTSNNLHAEVMLRNIGAVRWCMNNYYRTSLQILNAYLLHAGLNPADFVLYDGSGLSMKDLVAPRAQVQLLAYAAKQPWFAQWKAALPVGGVDGTLAGRFKDAKGVDAGVAALKGHVFAKTGTLGETRALAGYVEAASGKTVAFSVLVDNHMPGTSADREVMDKIVAAIAETQ